MHSEQDSVKEGYEVTDMNVRIISYFLIGMFVMLFGAVGAIVMIMRGFEESRPSLNNEAASPLAEAGMQVPDTPHLQQSPVADRVEIERANAAQINSYGTISTDRGMERVHIPVDIAMKRVAENKALYRQAPTSAQLPAAEQ